MSRVEGNAVPGFPFEATVEPVHDDPRLVVDRIRVANQARFSSPEGRASLRVIDLTFEERWIYLLELIQNAVDARARRIAIDFGEDWLSLQHDGPEPLTENSVKGLSGLFQSTKGVGTVGFMGIGFKSVFQRFQNVRISGFDWSFRYDVEVETGAEFGDRQPDLLGTVLPFWDEGIRAPDPEYTTRFELRELQDGAVSPAEDVGRALPAADRTVLALLAYRGVRELRIGEVRCSLEASEEAGSHLVVAREDGVEEKWRLFPVEYRPSKAAIARLLERRRIQPAPAERSKVYEEAARPRTVVGVVPVTEEDDFPSPPTRGKAYALLPTASTIPFGLHINADWLVNITRRGLPELEDNQWQNEVVDQIADVLAAYLGWLTTRHQDQEALRAGFSALRVPDDESESPIAQRMNSEEWRDRLRTRLRDHAILPGYEKGAVRLRRPGETMLSPGPLETLSDDPDASPATLFGGPTVAPGLLTRNGVEFVQWLGLVQQFTAEDLDRRWPAGLEAWWAGFEEEAVRRNLLYSVWAGLARLADDDRWSDLPTVPSFSGKWAPPRRVRFLKNEPMPGPDEPQVEAFLAPHLPEADVRPAEGLVETLRSGLSGSKASERRAAWDWFDDLATSVALAEVAGAAVAAELEAEQPRLDALIYLAQWARHRNRGDLVTHLVVVVSNARRAVPVGEALLAEPYVEHGMARRQIWPSAGVVIADYVESDPQAGDAHEWRVFFEGLHVLGPVRLQAQEQRAGRHQRQAVAEYLEVDLQEVGESNNAGYQLVDFDFDPPLAGVDVGAIAGWLEEGHAALKGKERRRALYQYNTPQARPGRRAAAWVDLLDSLAWVPCEDDSLRRPGDALRSFDPAREDAPVARLSTFLGATLTSAGIDFGSRVPEAPVLRRLQKRGSDLSTEELAATILEALAHAEAVPEDRSHLEYALRQISYPNPRGGAVPFERLVRTEGSGTRSGFGGWLAPLSAMPADLREVLLDHRMPIPIPVRTTGNQALEYVKHVWARAAAAEQGLAQEVGDFLPTAYTYVLADMEEDGYLAAAWEGARELARVFTNKRRWVASHGDAAPAFGDVEESLIRRFLPADFEVATGGHLGPTPPDQRRAADAIGLPRLSGVIAIVPKFGAAVHHPDWERRFADLLKVLAAERGLPEAEPPRMTLRPAESIVVEINGVPNAVDSFLQGPVLHVSGAPRRFAMDAVNYLVDAYGLSQQARTAVFLTILLSFLNDGDFFPEALERFGSEFAPEFDLASLTSVQQSRGPTPPGKVQEPASTDTDEGGGDHEEILKRAAEGLLQQATRGSEDEVGADSRGFDPGDGIPPSSRRSSGPSAEQQTRGGKGEMELLERLNREDGYLGLRLVRDRRRDRCGYDFLCRSITDDRDVEVELKTYTPGGDIHLTLRELERARKSGSGYVLMGLIDDGGHPSGWDARRLDDPYRQLVSVAEALIDVDLALPAESIFPSG